MEKRNGKTVSVIVPVYNGEKYLGRCMESILGQTWENMEILLVDDGSGDGSAEICDGFSQKDGLVKAVIRIHKGYIIPFARFQSQISCRRHPFVFLSSSNTVGMH